jgi:hypothetical protein
MLESFFISNSFLTTKLSQCPNVCKKSVVHSKVLSTINWSVMKREYRIYAMGMRKAVFPTNCKCFLYFPSATCFRHLAIFKREYTNSRNLSLTDLLELMVWPTVSRPIRLGVGHAFGAHDQIFLFPFFCLTIALFFVLGRPLWREDGSVICSAICSGQSRRGLLTIH